MKIDSNSALHEKKGYGFCKIVIDDPKILLRETDALCTHALSSLLHYVLALEEGADPVKLGLSKPEDREYALEGKKVADEDFN